MVLENKINKLDIESERKKKTLSDEPKKGITCKTIQISIVSLIYYYIQVTNAQRERARKSFWHWTIGENGQFSPGRKLSITKIRDKTTTQFLYSTQSLPTYSSVVVH